MDPSFVTDKIFHITSQQQQQSVFWEDFFILILFTSSDNFQYLTTAGGALWEWTLQEKHRKCDMFSLKRVRSCNMTPTDINST